MNNVKQCLGNAGSNPCERISNKILDGKNCMLQINCVDAGDVKILLKSLLEYGSTDTDNCDSKTVLNIIGDYISGPSHTE